jgi:hypothetical protein
MRLAAVSDCPVQFHVVSLLGQVPHSMRGLVGHGRADRGERGGCY